MTYDPRTTALVVVDMIYGCVEAHLGYVAGAATSNEERGYYPARLERTVLPAHLRLLDRCREVGVTVAFTILGSDFDDYRDLAPNVRPVIERRGARAGARAVDVLDELEPRAGELVVTKLGSGTWGTTDLDTVLRSAGVETILVTGTVTNGCILTTALGAWDHGFDVVVVEDACATLGQPLHDRALGVMSDFGIAIEQVDEVVRKLVPAGAD